MIEPTIAGWALISLAARATPSHSAPSLCGVSFVSAVSIALASVVNFCASSEAPPHRKGARARAAPRPTRPRPQRLGDCGGIRSSSAAHRFAGKRLRLEHLRTEADTEVRELLGELRTHARGLEVATEPAVFVD